MKARLLLRHLLLLNTGILLMALPASAEVLIHRYSFNEAAGSTTVVDSISGSNGVARIRVNGSFAFDGSKVTVTPGTANTQGGYIDLPNGLVSGLTNVALEFWVTWTAGGQWSRIMDFGAFNSGTEDPNGTAATGSGTGNNYMFLTPNATSATGTPRFTLTPASNGAAENPVLNSSLGNLSQGVEHHIVVNYGPDAVEMYIDGTNVATGTYATPLSALQDVNNWLGRSQWGDPNFGGSFNEFRIHDGVLHRAEVLAHRASGPDGPVNVSTPRLVSLSPANRTFFANAASGLSFTATSSAAIATNDITVTVNGVNVSAALQITGTPTSRQVTYNSLQANRPYFVEITVTNTTGLQVETVSFDTFVEASTPIIEAENYNFDGGQFYTTPVISTDPGVTNTYYQRGLLGITNVDFLELNGATRPTTTIGSEWRAQAGGIQLPQTDDSADFVRQAYVTAVVPDFDLVNIVAGEWLNYTRDYGAAGNYRVYLRASATGNSTMNLDRVTGDRTQTNQTTVLLGNFNIAAGGYGYTQLLGPDGKDMVVSLSGIQTLRLTAVVANNNLNINTIRLAPTTDPATVIGPYVLDRSPVPNTTNGRRDLIAATITNRATALAAGTAQLRLDGNLVTATVTPTATGAKVSYTVSPELVPGTLHTAELRYDDTLGNKFTNQWTFTTSTDAQGPLLSFTAGNAAGAQSKLRVYFSEPMDPVQAGAVSNYTSSGGVVFSAATVLENSQAVELTASGVAQGTIYTLTVNRVTDAIGNPIVANSTIKYNLSLFEQGLDANHLVVIEAESYFTNTPSTVPPATDLFTYSPVFPTEGFSGGGAMRTLPATGANIGNDPIGSGAARMDYRVVFNQTGTYTFWSFASAPGGGNMDSLSIGLDGAYVFSNTGMAPGAPTWRNGVQNGANAIEITTTGEHTINIWMRESGNIMDKFLLVPTNVATPVVNASTEVGPAQSRRTGDPFPPVLTLNSPTNGTKLASGAGVAFSVTVTDSDSASQLVEFYVDGAKVGEDSTSPYSFTASGVSDGYHAVSAKATDPTGLSSLLATAQIKVGNPKPRSLFVVSNPAALSTSDAMMKARMEGMGFEVIAVGDAASQTSDALLKEVVVESSTVASGNVLTKFQLVSVPVLNFEEANQDEYLFTGANERGTEAGDINVVIVNSAHPMAAGLSGTVNVYGTGQTIGFGIPAPAATIIATSELDPSRALIYGYENGALLVDGVTTAPARRVFMFPLDTFSALTTNGVKLWDAALSWAVGRTLVYSAQPKIGTITIGGGNVTISGTGGTAGGNYRVLGSTNVALPAAQWTEVGNGSFSGTGSFSSSIALTSDPQRFYLVVSP